LERTGAVILSVVVAAFGALVALLIRSHSNDIYAQIGLVLLTGLAGQKRNLGRAILRNGTGARRERAGCGAHGLAAAVLRRCNDGARFHLRRRSSGRCFRRRRRARQSIGLRYLAA
jgi:hypothetical protein